ncbi:unnamed protein product [Vicia faba]|uniref:mannose-6-phosphate isomerase n=1 Tax=Vicia faba TaxID=3906 RepID=A0AAV0YLM9_VICFA|nr:unnamed protein product [Vicia faba]
MTDFEALCGFITLEELKDVIHNVPEVVNLVGDANVDLVLQTSDQTDEEKVKPVLQAVFTHLMSASKEIVTKAVNRLINRLQLESEVRSLTEKELLVLRLENQYPSTYTGLRIAAFFLNHVKLNPGEALFLGANEPHTHIPLHAASPSISANSFCNSFFCHCQQQIEEKNQNSANLPPHSYLPPGQVTALHPYVMHQQGVPNSVASHVPQSHVGHFHPMPTMSPLQQWQNQQAVSEGLQVSIQDNPTSSQADQNLIRSDAKFNYEISVNGQTLPREYLDAHVHQGEEVQTVVSSSAGETQSVDKDQLIASQQSLQQISSQFSEALRLNSFKTNGEIKNPVTLSNDGPASQILSTE